jgi:hypothetical protein
MMMFEIGNKKGLSKFEWHRVVQAAHELGVLKYQDPHTGEIMWCLPEHLPEGVRASPVSILTFLDS